MSKIYDLIPDRSHTFSKAYHQYPSDIGHLFVRSGAGSSLFTNQGEFTDWSMGLGPVIKGYCFKDLNDFIKSKLDDGFSFSLPSEYEFFVAEKLLTALEFGEQVRFAKNGSDVTSAAIRLSRFVTNKDLIICNGYHGWQDWFIGATSRNGGVPNKVSENTLLLPGFSIEALEEAVKKNHKKLAAIILEPMIGDEPNLEFLKCARELSEQYGALLIFDECWTGFRCGRKGAIGYTQVIPDLSCYAKALGNGVPVSAIVGSKNLMKNFEEIFFSFTHASDPIGLSAADFMLDYLNDNFYEALNTKFNYLIEEMRITFDKILPDNLKIKVTGYSGKIVITPKSNHFFIEIKTYIQKFLFNRGILFNMYIALCEDHSEIDIKNILNAFEEIVTNFNDKNFDIHSETKDILVKPVFRRT